VQFQPSGGELGQGSMGESGGTFSSLFGRVMLEDSPQDPSLSKGPDANLLRG
jgi:hypothetical protein